MSYVTILRGDKPGTKRYEVVDGKPTKGQPHNPYKNDVEVHSCLSLHSLFDLIQSIQHDQHKYIIRGYPNKVVDVRGVLREWDILRRKENFDDKPLQWAMLDFDSIATFAPPNTQDAVEEIIETLLPTAFHNVSYIVQFSASAGLMYNDKPIKSGTCVHLFFWFDREVANEELNVWLKKSGVDTALFNNVQPHFVHTHAIVPTDIQQTITDKMYLVTRDQHAVQVPSTLSNAVSLSKTYYHHNVQSVEYETADNILRQLNDIQCIFATREKTINLWHRGERSPGGWYVYKDNPLVAHHHPDKHISIYEWTREYWGVELERQQQVQNGFLDVLEKFRQTKGERDRSKPLIEMTEPESCAPYSRGERGELLVKHLKIWKRSKHRDVLEYAAEGYGKSTQTAKWLVQNFNRVLFAVTDNQKIMEVESKYQALGFKVQAIYSRRHQLIQLGYLQYIVDKPPGHPWDGGQLNEDATKKALLDKMSQQEVDQLWELTKEQQVQWDNHNVVVVTHARLQVWGIEQAVSRKAIIPDNIVVIYDDPQSQDFLLLKDFSNEFATKSVFGRLIEQKQIGQKHYFVRPRELRVHFGIENRFVFTTTEILTMYLIEKQYDCYVPPLMPLQKLDAGRISILSSSIVRAKTDGILLPIFVRLRKEAFDFTTIGDGLGLLFNSVTNKGRNDLADKDVIVELSMENEEKVIRLQDELGEQFDKWYIKVILALDRLHQEVGRNSGYRFADALDSEKREAVVICEPALYNYMKALSRYVITYSEDLDAYSYAAYRKRPRETLVDAVAWYIQNLDRYICGRDGGEGNKSKQFVVDCQEVQRKGLRSVQRLLVALKNIKAKNKQSDVVMVLDETIEHLNSRDLFMKTNWSVTH